MTHKAVEECLVESGHRICYQVPAPMAEILEQGKLRRRRRNQRRAVGALAIVAIVGASFATAAQEPDASGSKIADPAGVTDSSVEPERVFSPSPSANILALAGEAAELVDKYPGHFSASWIAPRKAGVESHVVVGASDDTGKLLFQDQFGANPDIDLVMSEWSHNFMMDEATAVLEDDPQIRRWLRMIEVADHGDGVAVLLAYGSDPGVQAAVERATQSLPFPVHIRFGQEELPGSPID